MSSWRLKCPIESLWEPCRDADIRVCFRVGIMLRSPNWRRYFPENIRDNVGGNIRHYLFLKQYPQEKDISWNFPDIIWRNFQGIFSLTLFTNPSMLSITNSFSKIFSGQNTRPNKTKIRQNNGKYCHLSLVLFSFRSELIYLD